ncbi:MAG: hypothetical protein ACLQF1_15100 [Methyloceanibacter sp.]|jgi:hypothetical protein
MRISISTALLMASICLVPVAASAASGSYICAINEVYECQAVSGCQRASLDAINLSEFIVLDVDKKQLTSASIGEEGRTEDIEGLTSTDKAIFLYGTQGEDTWNATVSLTTGALTGGISSGTSSFALFGSCTQK